MTSLFVPMCTEIVIKAKRHGNVAGSGVSSA